MDRIVVRTSAGDRLMVEIAARRRDRARGLLGRDDLPKGHALLLPRARSIHTVGMRFPILVALLDARFRVLEVRRVPPGRLLLPRPGARHVLELGVSSVLRAGDRLVPDGSTDHGEHER